jgi:hypothetical protein
MAADKTGKKRGLAKRFVTIVVLLVIAPLITSAVGHGKFNKGWWEANRDPTGMAPDPMLVKEAVIQAYAARTFGWRGAFAVHTWFAVKPRDAKDYLRLEVVGWGVNRGRHAVRMRNGNPDNIWFDNVPKKLVDIRGPEAEALIPRIMAAAKRYPYGNYYKAWPGPNSNTFTAFVAREVPELKLELPAIAIGKDYLPNGSILAAAPSGTGFQLSAFGLAGIMVGVEEGLEINMLGLVFGLDFERPALKLPGLGRLGWSDGVRAP